MCVVTYFKTKNGFFLTSNRDEKNSRPTLCPKIYEHQSQQFVYPKDMEKGGTWFALDSIGKRIVCLLNIRGPVRNSKGRMSRGEIPIQYLIDEKSILSNDILKKTAPFALICIQYKKKLFLEEYRWNGHKLTLSIHDDKTPRLWCSETLYSETQKKRLTNNFKEQVHKLSTINKTVAFHKSMAQKTNNTVFLEKDKELQTVSIICFEGTKNKETTSYTDLLTNSRNVLVTTT